MNLCMKKIVTLSVLLVAFIYLNGCGQVLQAPDKQIRATLQLKMNNPTEADLQEAMDKIESRFAHFGVPITSMKANSEGQIELMMETFAKADNVRNFLTRGGNVAFYLCFRPEEFRSYKVITDEILALENDSIQNPFLGLIKDYGPYASHGIFSAKVADTAMINSIIKRNLTPKFFVDGREHNKFIWSAKPDEDGYLPLYAVETDPDGNPSIDGKYIHEARATYDMAGRPSITMSMNAEGAKIWENLTYEAYKSQKQIALSIDGFVYSAPGVTSGPITGGLTQLTGGLTVEETQELAQLISSGGIPPMDLVDFSSEPLE